MSVEFIEQELDWLNCVIEGRIQLYFEHETQLTDVRSIRPSPSSDAEGHYPELLRKYQPSFEERLIAILSLTPYLRPQALDLFFSKNEDTDRGYCEFGGTLIEGHNGFWPTLETAVFLIGGQDLTSRFRVKKHVAPHESGEAPTFLERVLDFSKAVPENSVFNQPLVVTEDFLNRIALGQGHHPHFSHRFPAQLITTALNWDDLVLPVEVMDQVEEIKDWIQHRDVLLRDWALEGKIQPGHRALFYGPPGTGKTLTATLLGKETGLPVYRIDLSMVVSKYIGETEKNLSRVFDQAEQQEWILFFDEADALFAKRTEPHSSNDRHANQQVAYLLQRIENFPGVILLATNLKNNIDDAFTRRFQTMIAFAMPTAKERLRLWQGAFSQAERVADDVCFQTIANKYELTGGSIVNVLRSASLTALRRGKSQVALEHLQQGIVREFQKLGQIALKRSE